MAEAKYLDFNIDPSERLQNEIYFSEDGLTTAIGKYLLKKFETDKVLANCYKERKIILTDIVDFVNNSASKYLGNKNGAISDEIVFGWVVHYVQDEKITIRHESKIEIELSTNEKEELREKAKEEYLLEEKKKLEKRQNAKIQKEKKKLEETGQMSLFDL